MGASVSTSFDSSSSGIISNYLSTTTTELTTDTRFSYVRREKKLKVPTSYVESDSRFFNKLRWLVSSLSGMPDGIGVTAWNNGLGNIIDAEKGVIVVIS